MLAQHSLGVQQVVRLRTLYEAAGISMRGVNLLARKGLGPEDLAQRTDAQLLQEVKGLGPATLAEIRAAFPLLRATEARLTRNTTTYTPGQWEWLGDLAERQGFGSLRLSELPALVRAGQFGDPALLMPRRR